MSIAKIKSAAKSLKTFQGINFESCLDNGETAEQMNKWLLEVSWEVANKGKYHEESCSFDCRTLNFKLVAFIRLFAQKYL